MNKNILTLIFLVVLIHHPVQANLPGENSLPADQNMPSFEDKSKGAIPGDRILPTLNFADPEVKAMAINAREKIQKMTIDSAILDQAPVPQRAATIKVPAPVIKKREDQTVAREQTPLSQDYFPPRAGIKIFPTLGKMQRNEKTETIVLPNGSTALVSSRAGIEVEEGIEQAKKLDIRLDYAFLGPNEAVVELTGCIGWIKVWGKYNTERIYGELEEISCRSPDGDTFTVAAAGIIKDFEEEYVGARGTFVANGKFSALALSFLQDGTNEFGKALSMAQVSKEVVSNDSNVESGVSIADKGKFVLGKSVSGATGRFLNWWVDFYTSLAPTLAIGPGKKMFITISREIEIPKKFFSDVKKVNTDQTLTQQQRVKE